MKNFDWFMSLVVCVSIVSVGAVFVNIEKLGKRAAKLLIVIAAIAIVLVGGKTAVAEPAEVEYFVVEEIVGVTAENFNGEVAYRIDFVFHDDVLSWYEDEPIYASRTYVLKIWRGQEVVNSAWL